MLSRVTSLGNALSVALKHCIKGILVTQQDLYVINGAVNVAMSFLVNIPIA